MTVRGVAPSDAVAIAAIYNYYIAETIVTFEEEPVTAENTKCRPSGRKYLQFFFRKIFIPVSDIEYCCDRTIFILDRDRDIILIDHICTTG